MSELFSSSGQSTDVSVAIPNLQNSFIPGLDNPNMADGLGIVYPLGGAGSARKYSEYGISAEGSLQDNFLDNLAQALYTPTGGGYEGIQGERGPQGLQGIPGLPGISGVVSFPPMNSNYLTELPENIDQINDLGTAADKIIYTSTYTTYYKFTWVKTSIAAIKSWNESDINEDASLFIIAADAGIYVSTDDGDSWDKYNPDADTYLQANCAASGGKAVALGTGGRDRGAILISSDSGVNWAEKTITV